MDRFSQAQLRGTGGLSRNLCHGSTLRCAIGMFGSMPLQTSYMCFMGMRYFREDKSVDPLLQKEANGSSKYRTVNAHPGAQKAHMLMRGS